MQRKLIICQEDEVFQQKQWKQRKRLHRSSRSLSSGTSSKHFLLTVLLMSTALIDGSQNNNNYNYDYGPGHSRYSNNQNYDQGYPDSDKYPETKEPPRQEDDQDWGVPPPPPTGYDTVEQQSYANLPPPPPPPPDSSSSTERSGGRSWTPASTAKLPIHYEFSKTNWSEEGNDELGRDEGASLEDLGPQTTSARQDLITKYLSTTSGKLQVYSSASLVGASTGYFLGKSFLPFNNSFWAVLFSFVFCMGAIFFRTPFGELVRALGLALILVLQRTKGVRRNYPTWRYVKASLGMKGRRLRPFPPARNPWKYSPQRENDPEFNMLYSLIAMALVGSTVGGNLPMIPTWMGSLAGAAVFALGCTRNTPRGDLCRTLGMRVVGLIQELWEIQAELSIVPKAAVVSSQVIDRLMILDRQHKVKDRFLSLMNAGYEQVLQTGAKVQAQRLDAQGRGRPRDREEDEDVRRDRPGPNSNGSRGPPGREATSRRDWDERDKNEDRFSSRSNEQDRRRDRPLDEDRRDDLEEAAENEQPRKGWFGRRR